jgi:hypothetical protein
MRISYRTLPKTQLIWNDLDVRTGGGENQREIEQDAFSAVTKGARKG